MALGVAAVTSGSTSADATVNAGIEAGIAKRIADDPGNLSLGFGWQLHAEGTVLPPILNLGPYYTHYQLDSSTGAFDNAVFNIAGLRARAFIPIPGPIKPYGYVGAGYSWVSYHGRLIDVGGHFLETPIGAGVSYDCIPILQLSLDAAYRPGMAFGGDAYGPMTNPSGGYTVLFGAAINL
jgi:hypothetical protein